MSINVSKKSDADLVHEKIGSNSERKILTSNEIKKRLNANSWLIDVAAPYLNNLIQILSQENLAIFLTDMEGCILHIATSENLSLKLRKNFIITGSFAATTSLLGKVIEEVISSKSAVESNPEPSLFDSDSDSWVCWAYPLFFRENHFVGSMALYMPKSSSSKYLKILLRQAVICLEQAVSFKEEKLKAKKIKEQQLSIFNRHAQSDIVIDKLGDIQLISDKACELLGVSRSEIEQKRINTIIPRWESISFSAGRWIEVENLEIEIANVPKSGLYLLNTKAIWRTSTRIEEMVCSLRSMKQVLNEANKYIGNTTYTHFEELIGFSNPIKQVFKEAKSIAQIDSPLLIYGEANTGRETLAKAIHNFGKRSTYGFVRVDLATLSTDEMEEVLWGYAEGYNGISKRISMPGVFEFADGGTLFINEIGVLPLALQEKFLTVMQNGVVCRLGSDIQTIVNARVISCSSADLSAKIDRGEFRIDFFYALSNASLRIPPLRQRRADIPLLLQRFMEIKSKQLGIKAPQIPKKILLILKRYEWPENFKEMKEFVERAINDEGKMFKNFKNERVFKQRHLYLEQLKEVESIISLEEHERKLIEKAYFAYNKSISKASRNLGISRNTLYLKLKKYGIDVNQAT